jgi:drug/metabolite transporter (DMT)-like permease
MTTPHAPARASYVLVMVAATFLMGSSFVAGKILLTDGFPPMLLVGWRFLAAALAMVPLVLLDGTSFRRALAPPGLRLRDAAAVILIGILQTAAVMGLLFLALRTISAATAAILLFTNPIWVALLGRIFLAEPLHGARVTGLGLGIVGVALATGAGGIAPDLGGAPGELVALAAALCWAAATIVNKRAALPLRAWALSFWQMLTGSLVLLGIGYGAGEHWPAAATPADWGWFLWLAVPASTGSFGLWFVALRRGGATRSSGFLFLAPLFAAVLSRFVLGATLGWLQGAGGVLIGVALWLVNREMPARDAEERLREGIAEGQP